MTEKNVPFHEVIRRICGYEVIPLSRADTYNKTLLESLERVAKQSMKQMIANPIERSRPNEVGNDVESYVKQNLQIEAEFRVVNMRQSTGYPDIMVRVNEERIVYIECKTFNPRTVNTSFRSFYLSPSPTFKIQHDAVHIAISFGMNRNGNLYTPFEYKLIDLYDLPCDLKLEWNSDNRRLYDEQRVLAP